MSVDQATLADYNDDPDLEQDSNDTGSWYDSTKGSSGGERVLVPSDEPECIIKSALDDTEWDIEEVAEDSNLFANGDYTISIVEEDDKYVVEWKEIGCRYPGRHETAVLVASIMRRSPTGFEQDVDEDSPDGRWRDYGMEPHEPTEDAGISDSGALAILNRPALTDWDAEDILTQEERTKGEEASDHSFSR